MHKTALVALFGAMAFATSAIAQDATTAPQAAGTGPTTALTPEPAAVPAVPQMAKIVMYRGSSVMGAALGCPIRYKEKEVVELGRGKYAEWVVPAGHYILTNKTASVDVHVDAGDTAYIRCQIKPGMLTGRADLQIVDKESFAEHQADYAKKEVELTPAS